MSKGGCKCKKEECEECPEWIFTFADLVMLMMGFFVILWVTKPSAPKDKPAAEQQNTDYLNVIAGIRSAFGYVPDAKSQDPVDQRMIHLAEHLPPKEGLKEGNESQIPRTSPEGANKEVTTVRPGRQAIVRGGRLMFDPGSVVLSDLTKQSLDQIAQYIAGHYNIMLIKGHTSLDDFPAGATAAQQMQLSISRAQAVADYLTAHGVRPDMLRIQGCSTFEPVAERAYTSDLEAQNRRVEIEETDTLIEQRQDPSEPVHPDAPDAPHAN